jgi:hypothetical protein
MTEETRSSETSVLTRAMQRNISEGGIILKYLVHAAPDDKEKEVCPCDADSCQNTCNSNVFHLT